MVVSGRGRVGPVLTTGCSESRRWIRRRLVMPRWARLATQPIAIIGQISM